MMQAVNGKSTHTEGYYLADKNAETTLEAFKSYHVIVRGRSYKLPTCYRTSISCLDPSLSYSPTIPLIPVYWRLVTIHMFLTVP